MKRFLRRTIYGLVPATLAALVLGVPTAAPDLGVNLKDVNLACNDGTDLALSLDVAAATQLSDAVSAINLYPAGDPALACSLTQPTSLSSAFRTFSSSLPRRTLSASGSPNYDYAVGGGRAMIVTRCQPSETNFSLNARVSAGTTTPASGHVNFTIPQCFSTYTLTSYSGSHLSAKVDCLQAAGMDANLTATVEKTTGVFANPNEPVFPPTYIAVHVHDSGMPGGLGDTIDWTPTALLPCQPTGSAPETVDNGNLSVHDAM